MLHALCDPVTAVSEWKSVGLLEKTRWKDIVGTEQTELDERKWVGSEST